MTGSKHWFNNLRPKKGDSVRFGDGAKGTVIGIGNVGKDSLHHISDVLLVKGLTHNLLSVSQLCDQGLKVEFSSKQCIVSHPSTNKIILKGKRLGNTYITSLEDLMEQDVKCLATIEESKWLWHRKLGHAHMRLLATLS